MKYLILISLLIINNLLNEINCVNINPDNPVVTTRYGQVRGRSYQNSGSSGPGITQKPYVQFIGIPYAKAPTGGLRFMVRNNFSLNKKYFWIKNFSN